nr:MAG TPA: putative transposase [Caudoviricetes sp.]
MKYDVGLKKYRDTLSVLEGTKQDGLAEGRAKGLEEGRMEGIQSEKAETAKRLLAIGMDINTIAMATGLSAKDIETIIKL